jgi:glycosyltransferase involved in cell wall biosynthesis
VRFVAAGRGPLEEELRGQAARLGLGDHFTFLGYRSDVARVMGALDIFCLASHYEGLPIALLEALAVGIPVVATDVGGISEVVTDGKEAVLVPPSQPSKLAAALTALALDPDRRSAMAEQARARADTLDAPRSVREIEAVYFEAVSSGTRAQ